MTSLITVIGIVAAIGTTACWLPQVVKTVRSGSANDFSWAYLAMLVTGVACWTAYGFLRKDWVVLGANAATLVLVSIVTWVKLRGR